MTADAGPADAGPVDAGASVRQLIQRPLFGPMQADNHMLAADFDTGMFNLGWSSGAIEGGPAPLIKRYDPRVPGARPQWVEIRARDAAPGGAFLIGFSHAPTAPPRLEVWIAQTQTATAPGDGVEVGLHGVTAEGEQRVLFLEPTSAGETTVDGWRWRRWVGEDEARWIGFATLVVLNRASTPLAVGTPTLRAAPASAVQGELDRARPGRVRAPRDVARRRLAEIWRTQRSRASPEGPQAEILRAP